MNMGSKLLRLLPLLVGGRRLNEPAPDLSKKGSATEDSFKRVTRRDRRRSSSRLNLDNVPVVGCQINAEITRPQNGRSIEHHKNFRVVVKNKDGSEIQEDESVLWTDEEGQIVGVGARTRIQMSDYFDLGPNKLRIFMLCDGNSVEVDQVNIVVVE